MKMEFDFPEEIIQHIHSFMDAKETARTCLLSKSWYRGWASRPIVAFDVQLQCDNRKDAAISESIQTSMKRYKESNNNLHKLDFRMINLQKLDFSFTHRNQIPDKKYTSLIDELVRDASKLGVKEINMAEIDRRYSSHRILVPATVFTITSLVNLSIEGCSIHKLPPVDTISPLVSLRLNCVDVGEDNSIIQGILLRCPSIQNLHVKFMYWKGEIVSINLGGLHDLVSLRVLSKLPGKPKVSFECITSGGLVNSVPQFHKLRSVSLEWTTIEGGFFTDFSSRFPCIEDLSLKHWGGYEEYIQISSKSLKYLNLVLLSTEELKKAEFDVPNIRKFGFKSYHIPALSFSTVSREWESRVEFSLYCGTVEASWFVRLGELLEGLSKSRISLHLNIRDCSRVSIFGDLPCSPTPLVEILTVNDYRPQAQTFLTALIVCCRPRSITLISRSYMSQRETIKFMRHAQWLFENQKNTTKCSSMMQSLITYHFKKFEEKTSQGEWQTVEMEKKLNTPKLRHLRVKWGASNVAEPSL